MIEVAGGGMSAAAVSAAITAAIAGKLDASAVSAAALGVVDEVTTAAILAALGGQPIVANVSDTEIGYLNNVSSNIQTQLDARCTRIVTVTTQTGNYTLTDADSGCYIICNHASGMTITVPNTLSAGFICELEQRGAGQITFAASGGNTLRNRSSHTKTAGIYARVSVACPDTSNAVLAGDTGA